MRELVCSAALLVQAIAKEKVKENPDLYVKNGVLSELAVITDAWYEVQGEIEKGFLEGQA